MEFKPEQKILNELFGIDITVYEIPSYQRPYSWACEGKSDRDNQVNTMWADLVEHFDEQPNKVYFMGAMVMIANSTQKATYQVIDGQQRLITLTLLFVAIKCMLKSLNDSEIEVNRKSELKDFIDDVFVNLDLMLFNKKLLGVVEQEKKVKIQSVVGFDYDKVLKMALDCKNFDSVSSQCRTDEQKTVAERYFKNRDYFREQLKERFTENGLFTYEKAMQINNFIRFLKDDVTVVRILAPSFDSAYHIFEILNNRGLPLSNKDLFRNFIISELSKAGINDVEAKWLELDSYEFNHEFVSRYVESKKATKQRYSAFNDLQEIYKNNFEDTLHQPQVLNFYDDVKNYLHHFTNIVNLNFESKAIKHRLEFLQNSGNSRYVLNLLLSLFSHVVDEEKIVRFLSEFELFILYVLLGPSKRFQVAPIFQAIALLNKGDFDNALNAISLGSTDKSELASILKVGYIHDNDLAKLVIARYLWAQDLENPDDVVDLGLNYNTSTLEHIIPQTPDKSTNWFTDFGIEFRKDYTYRIGNFALLTQKMNSKVKNYDFSKKRETYKKMKLPQTAVLGSLEKIDEAYIRARHEEISNNLVRHFKLEG